MVHENRTIDFHELRVFAAVVRHGGITAAADAIGMSKSAVSLQVTRLERRLGARLLERSSRRVALTREGETMLPRIQSLLAEAENLMEEALQAKASPRGTVRISVSPALGGAVLEHLVPALRNRFPDISLVVVSNYEMDDLQNPAFDFAIRLGHIRDESLVANKIGTFRRILVCAPSDRAASLSSIDALNGAFLLNFSGRSTDVAWRLQRKDGSGAEITLDCDAQVAIQDFDLLLRLARLGHGTAMVPEFMVRTDLAHGRLVHVLPEWQSPPVDVMLAHRIGISRVSRVAAVLEEARRAVEHVLGGDNSNG